MKSGMYLRGEVYLADLGQGIGSEQGGIRPVVILQNDLGNRYSPTVIVAAITSRKKERSPIHCPLNREAGLKYPSTILLEQLRTIDKQRLEGYIGKLGQQHMRAVNRAISYSLGLDETYEGKPGDVSDHLR